jgi:hypothetical protein
MTSHESHDLRQVHIDWREPGPVVVVRISTTCLLSELMKATRCEIRVVKGADR